MENKIILYCRVHGKKTKPKPEEWKEKTGLKQRKDSVNTGERG